MDVKDYKRLTIKTDKGYLQPCQQCYKEARHLDCDIYDCAGVIIQRLGEIEDKIEQGRLIELPCNCRVRDIVYEFDAGDFSAQVYCTKSMDIIAIYDGEEEAISAWNTRAKE